MGFVWFSKMDQSPPHEQQQQLQMQSPSSKGDMIDCVIALERALLPCLPARELQAIDRSAHPSHQSKIPPHIISYQFISDMKLGHMILRSYSNSCSLKKWKNLLSKKAKLSPQKMKVMVFFRLCWFCFCIQFRFFYKRYS